MNAVVKAEGQTLPGFYKCRNSARTNPQARPKAQRRCGFAGSGINRVSIPTSLPGGHCQGGTMGPEFNITAVMLNFQQVD